MKDSQLPDSQNPYQAPQGDTGQLKSNNAEYAEFKLFSIKGRVGRIRYLLYFWLPMAITIQMVGILGVGERGRVIVAAVFMLGVGLTLTVQRLHDFNMSGLFVLLGLILNIVFLLALL